MIADFDGDISTLLDTKVEGSIPILTTRNMVLFPGVITPILIGRPASLNLVKKMQKNPKTTIAVFCQKNPDVETPRYDDLHSTGVYARLIRIMDMPRATREMHLCWC